MLNFLQQFEEFLSLDPVVQEETKSNKDTKQEERKEFTGLNIRANNKDELILVVTGLNISKEMEESIRKLYCEPTNDHIKSVYCKSFYSKYVFIAELNINIK